MSGENRIDPDEMSGWLRHSGELVRRTFEVANQLTNDWDSMAQADRQWTTDTIMNEVVNSWEHFTPVMGDWIQHGIDGMSMALRSVWPSASEQFRAAGERVRSLPGGADAATYLDISASAAERMVAGRYESADAVEDWAVMCGKLTKDTWQVAAEVRAGRLPRAR